MKVGYKTTPIGLLPEQWEAKLLKEAAWFQEGPGLRKWQFTESGIKVINITNMVDGCLDLTKTDRHISWDEFRNKYKHFECDENDIVIASSGNSYCKHAVIRKCDLPLVMNTSVIRFKPNNKTNYSFLNQFLKSQLFKKQIDFLITGGAQPNFGPEHLNKVFIPYPSIPEQQKIAEILSTVDEKIEVINDQIQQTQQLKKGLMHRLLTKGIGHTKFKLSQLGEIPESWVIYPLEKLVDSKRPIRYGIVQTGENVINGVPCLRVADFSLRKFSIDAMISTSHDISSKYPSTILQKGDIVFPLRGRIGDVKLVDSNLAGINITRGVALISNSDKILPEYLLWQLISPAVIKEIMLKVNGTTLQEIPITGLKSVYIPVAPPEEQLKISMVLSTITEKLEVLQDKKEHYQTLKKGLMQQLLTGKLRVNHLVEEPELA